MAERRMFAKTIIDSDAFLDMPLSTQALYFHLSMRADDDGFINNPRKIQRMIGASGDDLKLLLAKSFLIPFESGIVVIKHWRIHNYIQKDRYKETMYLEEKEQLGIKENKEYTLDKNEVDTQCIHDVYSLETQVRLGKDSIDKDSIDKDIYIPQSDNPEVENPHMENPHMENVTQLNTNILNTKELNTNILNTDNDIYTTSEKKAVETRHKYGEYKHVMLKDSEYEKLADEYGEPMRDECITFLDEYIEMKGYKAKNHYLCIRKWVANAVKEKQKKQGSSFGNTQSRLSWIDNITM